MLFVPTVKNGFYRSCSHRWLDIHLALMDLLGHLRFGLGRHFLIYSYLVGQQPRQGIRQFLQVADLLAAHYEISC